MGDTVSYVGGNLHHRCRSHVRSRRPPDDQPGQPDHRGRVIGV